MSKRPPYRLYSAIYGWRAPVCEDLERILAMVLEEVRALLKLAASDGGSACAEVRELAADHLTEVRAKLADLKAMERALTDAVRRCDAGEMPGCPLIDALSR